MDVWSALPNQTQAPFDEFGRKYVWTLFNHKHTIQAKWAPEAGLRRRDTVKSLKNGH